MSEQLAEQWFQALRSWRARTIYPPRYRPWKPRGPMAPPRPTTCPVCRSARVEEYETRIERATLMGGGLKRTLRQIAKELGIRPRQVEVHASGHMLREPPTLLIGEWVYGGVEYVRTPVGWIPSSRVMTAIRDSQESRLLLEAIRRGRKQTLLHKGYFRDEKSRRIGRALLQIDTLLRFPQFVL